MRGFRGFLVGTRRALVSTMSDTLTLISSQRYRDPAIVAAKLAAEDYTVQVSPEFEIDGERYAVVVDGHHSLAAALEAAEEPFLVECRAGDFAPIRHLYTDDIETFLAEAYYDDPWHNAETGELVELDL